MKALSPRAGSGTSAGLLDGLLLACELYLSRTCGIEPETFDFETASPAAAFSPGGCEIEPFQLIGRGACAGLKLQVSGIKVNPADGTFGEEVRCYPLELPPSARVALNLARWPASVRDEYLKALADGQLPLRVMGSAFAPLLKFPWPETKAFGRRALFGMERIADRDALDRAREHLRRVWGETDADLAAAAALGDRMGVGLPGTLSARQVGETIIDRVPGLPQSLLRYLSIMGPPLEPRQALKQLLHPSDQPVPAGAAPEH